MSGLAEAGLIPEGAAAAGVFRLPEQQGLESVRFGGRYSGVRRFHLLGGEKIGGADLHGATLADHVFEI